MKQKSKYLSAHKEKGSFEMTNKQTVGLIVPGAGYNLTTSNEVA